MSDPVFKPPLRVCLFCRQPFIPSLRGTINLADYDCEVHDMAPCPICQSVMDKGYTLLGIRNTPIAPGQPPASSMYPDKYLTGRFIVVPEAFARKILENESAEQLINGPTHKMFLDDNVLQAIITALQRAETNTALKGENNGT